MQSRETIYSNLFSTLVTASGVKSSSRREKDFSQVDSGQSPALFLVQQDEDTRIKEKIPTIWTLRCDVVLVVITPSDSDAVPASTLNPLVDAIVATLMPTGANAEQTLGGIVTRCRVSGKIRYADGAQENSALVIIPIEIITV